jgi:hypothetical protein
MKNSLILALLALVAISAHAQGSIKIARTLAWATEPQYVIAPDGQRFEVPSFENAGRADLSPFLPQFSERVPLNTASDLEVVVANAEWETTTLPQNTGNELIPNELQPVVELEQERLNYFARVKLLPLRRSGTGSYERLKSFTLEVRTRPLAQPLRPMVGDRNAIVSKLNDGDIYKFGVEKTSIYKITYEFLKNKLGVSNLDNIDPRNIQVLGNGGFMLPEKNIDPRPEDLNELAVFVSGEEDGKFNSGDYILFYAVGPTHHVLLGGNNPQLSVRTNLYDRQSWYFIKIGSETGKRVANFNPIAEVPVGDQTAISTQFDDAARIEEENYNLLAWSPVHQGSGKVWYGDIFEQTRVRNYELSFPNIVQEPTPIRMEFAGRCDGTATLVNLTADGSAFSGSMNGTDNDNNNASIASHIAVTGTFLPNDDKVELKVDYPNVGKTSQGWLQYIEVDARRALRMTDKMLVFRDLRSRLRPATTFRLSGVNTANFNLWDITTLHEARNQAFTNTSGTVSFGANTDNVVRTYVAFNTDGVFPEPETHVGLLSNQNLHGLAATDMVIVYPTELEAQALQLAQHRRTYNNIDVTTVRLDLLFNEFSSGAKDPVAIRDFARYLFELYPDRFKYMLLFGDGSFDPKNNLKSDNHADPMVVWETSSSLDPIGSHPSDDFFALLSPNEGPDDVSGLIRGAMEIAVGRIPANTVAEAQGVVNKIISYDQDPAALGDWHIRQIYVADDQESFHIDQAENLSKNSEIILKYLNSDKIYFDAYQRVASSSEKRIPDAKAAINANMFKGALTMNYIGHGGPKGWGQERVLDIADIQGWENRYKLPLFITATCSFGGFDNHNFVTGGELVLLQPSGGGMGLFTTVRPVFIGANDILTNSVLQFIFKKENDKYLPIGDILTRAKNQLSSSIQDNGRRFLLFGDPSQRLAMPEYAISTDSINGRAVIAGQPDTLRALQRGSISGSVTDGNGNIVTSFNGRVSVTIFDKPQQLRTLAENGSPLREYLLQRNILFRGSVTAKNGKFRIAFVIPKDINYAFGAGKISYYAEDGTPIDAAGHDLSNLVIGGTSQDVKDDQPPLVQVFLNTDAFVSGGITDDDPKILVKCADDNGMNVSGTSLGHDLAAVLDENVAAGIILNEFYESALDNPMQGKAIYPLRNLAPGKHTLRVKGWDIANNSGEGYTEFVVAQDGKAALDHVLNYPNPFTTNTAFQFEHNLAGQTMDVQISIFSVSGKLVKTIQHNSAPESYRVTDIAWDGRDEYGDQLAKGVYVYRVKVRGTDAAGQQVLAESDYEKLVILK